MADGPAVDWTLLKMAWVEARLMIGEFTLEKFAEFNGLSPGEVPPPNSKYTL